MKQIPGYKTLSPFKDGEPVFTLRAKDNYSVAVLRLIQNIYGIDDAVIELFEQWRAANKDVCKDPD